MAIPQEKVVASAAAFVPPAEQCEQIEAIRRVHDKAFARWPPHVNLLFPFVAEAHMAAAVNVAELALGNVAPFEVSFDTLSHFDHGRSVTLIAVPAPDRVGAWTELQSALTRAFPWCDDQSTKSGEGFTAHLTLGQFASVTAAQRFVASCAWRPFSVRVSEIAFVARSRETRDRFVTRHVVRLGHTLHLAALASSLARVGVAAPRDIAADSELNVAERAAAQRVVAWLRERVAQENAPRSRDALARAVTPLCTTKTTLVAADALLATLVKEKRLSITDDEVSYTEQMPPTPALRYDASEVERVHERARQWLSTHQTRPRTKPALLRALAQLCVVNATVDAHNIVAALERADIVSEGTPHTGAVMDEPERAHIVAYLESELFEIARLQYDTRIPGDVVESRTKAHLHEHVTFVDPWQEGGGLARYLLGQRGFHAMLRFHLTVAQVACRLAPDARTARVMLDAAMHLRVPSLLLPRALTPPSWISYPLRVILVYELDLSPPPTTPSSPPKPSSSSSSSSVMLSRAPPVHYTIRTHEEMWSFGDMLAEVPLLGAAYSFFRRAFAVGFLAMSYVTVHCCGRDHELVDD